MTFADAVGSAFLYAQKRATGGFYPQWRARFRFPGEALLASVPNAIERDAAFSVGVAICPACLKSLAMADEAARRAALEACKRKDCRRAAEDRCHELLKAWTDEMWRNAAAVPAVPEVVEKSDVSTVGDLLDAWASGWQAALSETNATEARRQALSFLRVLAFGFDAWTVKEAGVGPKGVKVGDRYPDEERLRRLPLAEALTSDAALAYQRAACAAVGVPCSWADSNRRAEYGTINSTLRQARCLFTKLSLEFVLKDKVMLPASLAEWKGFRLLPELPPEPEPFTGETFARLVEAGEALRETEPMLWLCARIFRQTALRCGSMMELRGEWVERINGGWMLVAKAVKSGTRPYAVKLREDTAEAIRACGPGYLFGETDAERHAMVYSRHNALIKAACGQPVRGSQGAHRLRDTLAGALCGVLGADGARAALGHENVEVTLRHYARVPFEATPQMREEFAAFIRA